MRDYYNMDEVLLLEKHLNALKGQLLMDDNGGLFLFKDFNTVAAEVPIHLFSKKTKTVYYLDKVHFQDHEGEHVHRRGYGMCTSFGVEAIARYSLNYSEFQKKMIKFVTATGIPISFVPYQTESSLGQD